MEQLHGTRRVSIDLPMLPSGQSTRASYAVGHDEYGGRGSNLSPGASACQRIISNNTYVHDQQGDNPGPEQIGFDGDCKLWPLLMPWLAASRY